MVEAQPQESSRLDKVLEKQKELEEIFASVSKDVHEEKEAEAKARIEGFVILKENLNEKLMVMHEAMEDVKREIKDNAKDGGLLTRDEQKYLGCLELKNQELETFF